ncbi:MAG TPA: MBL fold metallo-hydrolase [Clostridiaceae bacterium]|nr:MBL fold metallo-hydrolase [Clostridiaceae bacterium]
MADIIQINDTNWRVEDNGVRFFLLSGTEKALLIDSGRNTPNAKQIAESITKLPIMLLNTHADPDHISGNGSFGYFYMHPEEEDNYRAHGGVGSILPVKENDIIDLGNRPLKIIFIPGHTPGSIAVLDINNRVLISGDTIQDGNIFMFKEHRNLSKYVESLKKLSMYTDEFDIIYPSHGSFPVYPELIASLIEGAEQIINGTAKGKVVDMFGTPVMLYKFPYAGFLCDIPENKK